MSQQWGIDILSKLSALAACWWCRASALQAAVASGVAISGNYSAVLLLQGVAPTICVSVINGQHRPTSGRLVDHSIGDDGSLRVAAHARGAFSSCLNQTLKAHKKRGKIVLWEQQTQQRSPAIPPTRLWEMSRQGWQPAAAVAMCWLLAMGPSSHHHWIYKHIEVRRRDLGVEGSVLRRQPSRAACACLPAPNQESMPARLLTRPVQEHIVAAWRGSSRATPELGPAPQGSSSCWTCWDGLTVSGRLAAWSMYYWGCAGSAACRRCCSRPCRLPAACTIPASHAPPPQPLMQQQTPPTCCPAPRPDAYFNQDAEELRALLADDVVLHAGKSCQGPVRGSRSSMRQLTALLLPWPAACLRMPEAVDVLDSGSQSCLAAVFGSFSADHIVTESDRRGAEEVARFFDKARSSTSYTQGQAEHPAGVAGPQEGSTTPWLHH